jgi:polysaccharide export outer membrane protein
MTSCLSYKQIVNFQDGQDLGPGKADSIANQHPVRLQTDDVVMINVTSFNLEEANRFNVIPNMQVGQMQQLSGNTVNEPFGYRVNQNGQIELPVIGNVFVRGLTLDSLHDVVLGKVKATGYLKDPAVQVRFELSGDRSGGGQRSRYLYHQYAEDQCIGSHRARQ